MLNNATKLLFLTALFRVWTDTTSSPSAQSASFGVQTLSFPLGVSDKLSISTTNPVIALTFSEAIRPNFNTAPPSSPLFDFRYSNGSSLNEEVNATYAINGAVVIITLVPITTASLPHGDWEVVLTNQWQSLGYDNSTPTTIPIFYDSTPPQIAAFATTVPGKQGRVFTVSVEFDELISTQSDFCSCITTSNASVVVSDDATTQNSIQCLLTAPNNTQSTAEAPLIVTFNATCTPITDIIGNVFSQATPQSIQVVYDAVPPTMRNVSVQRMTTSGNVSCPFTFDVFWSEELAEPPTMLATIDQREIVLSPQSVSGANYTYSVLYLQCNPAGNSTSASTSMPLTIVATNIT